MNSGSSRRPCGCSPEIAAELSRILVGCFRKSDAEDPDVLVRAYVMVLSDYSEAIARRVTHPSRGLPSRQQWLPSVFELRQACEAEMRPTHEAERRRTIAERNRALLLAAPAHSRSAALARLRAEFPEIFSPMDKGRSTGPTEPPREGDARWSAEDVRASSELLGSLRQKESLK